MYLIELSDFSAAPIGSGSGLKNIYFSLSDGDVCSIKSDSTDDAHMFLKVLATLLKPQSGTYRYIGRPLDFSDYRNLLPLKRKIGYIGQDSAMISNRTIRENLLLMKSYFENSLSPSLDEDVMNFCKRFNLQDKLDLRPGDLQPVDLRIAVAIREFTKSFEVLLLERPEDYFDHSSLDIFNEVLKDILEHGKALVFFSQNPEFVETFSNRKVLITGGALTKIPQ